MGMPETTVTTVTEVPAARQQTHEMQTQAQASWHHAMKVEVHPGDTRFPAVAMDQPREFGGEDSAARPVDYLMGALVGSMSQLVSVAARELNFTIDRLEIKAVGTFNKEGMRGQAGVRPYLEKVEGQVAVWSEEIPEALMKLKEAVENRCPVYTLLTAANVGLSFDWHYTA